MQQQEALINAKRYHQNLTERAADLDALEALAKESPKVLNSSIGSLTQQIEALGAVNLAAATGGVDAEFFWTDDHYDTFSRIRR